MGMRRVLPAVAALLLAGPAAATAALACAPTPRASQPPAPHVFVIMLENQSYAATFGTPSADPYLASTLVHSGALLTHYYGTGHESLDNYISLISGQAPNAVTQSDCQAYLDLVGPPALVGGQQVGQGCVYPATVPTLASQLTAAGKTWKAYEQDMGNVPTRESATCGHPALNSQDHTQSAVPGDGYATRHDPFMYFHAIIDARASCAQHVVPLGTPSGALPATAPAGTTGLATDLASVATTPNLSFITPNLCNDGHDYPCTNQPSGASALADIDAFLATWVPKITSSPAYRQGGLLLITFDESEGPQSDASACCNEQPGPGSALPGITGLGGGRVGAVVLSPHVAPGTVSSTPYNHYAALATMEKLFGLGRLGEAATVTSTFGPDVFTR